MYYFLSSRTKKVESTQASFENDLPTDGCSSCTFWESFPRTFYTTQTALLKGPKAPATPRSQRETCSIALCCQRAEKGMKQVCKETTTWMLLQPFFHPRCSLGAAKAKTQPQPQSCPQICVLPPRQALPDHQHRPSRVQ